jgi:hypothetical protein
MYCVFKRIVVLSQENAATLDSNVHHAPAPYGSSSLWPDKSGVMAHATQAVEEARQEAYNHATYVPASYHWFVPLVACLDNIKTNSWTHRTGLAASAPLVQEHITIHGQGSISKHDIDLAW